MTCLNMESQEVNGFQFKELHIMNASSSSLTKA